LSAEKIEEKTGKKAGWRSEKSAEKVGVSKKSVGKNSPSFLSFRASPLRRTTRNLHDCPRDFWSKIPRHFARSE